MTNAHDVVAACWAAAEARDRDGFGALLAHDVIYRGPQAREQGPRPGRLHPVQRGGREPELL